MEMLLPAAGIGLVLGWPIEWTIQRFPRGEGTLPSRRRMAIVAAITAGLFGLLALAIGPHARLVPALLLTALVVPASVIDLRHRIIPNAINLPGAAIVYATAVAAQPDRWLELLLGGLGGFLFLGLAWRISPAGMGLGDVKMALMIGLALGEYMAVGLFAALIAACVPSLWVIGRHGLRSGRKVGLPFGPFLAAGAVVGLAWGPQLLHWYVSHGG